ncbi:MAG: DUF4230 domain-containing protein [Thermoguttaceae bacterium]
MRITVPAAVLLTAASLSFLLPRLVPMTMRPTALVLLVVAAASSAVLLIPRLRYPVAPAPVVVHSNGPTVEKLERLAALVATRVQIAGILVAEGQGCRGCWVIKGDALLSINMAQAKITDRHEDTKQATIVLPEPQVLQPRVDHSRTRTWSVERVAWLPWHADQDSLRDAVYAEAQQLVAHTAASKENIQAARVTAEVVIKSLYSGKVDGT